MAFVKLDCGLLDSTLWVQREQREIFITALLMAVPFELTEETEQIEVGSLNNTGYVIQPGWYGFVHAAGVGIIRRAQIENKPGMSALTALCSPDTESRSPEHEGRRMARVNGGYLILNFQKYREKDHTAAARSRRYREKQKEKASRVSVTPSRVTGRSATQAEAEAEAEALKKKKRFAPPSLEEVKNYCLERKNGIDPQAFIDHYEANGWVRGKTKIKSWKACVRTWEAQNKSNPGGFQKRPGKMQRAAESLKNAQAINSGTDSIDKVLQDAGAGVGLLPK